MQDNTERPEIRVAKSNASMMQLLGHEMTRILSTDKTLKKLEAVLTSRDALSTMSFEQIQDIYKMIYRKGNDSKMFILEFAKITSKSESLAAVLEKMLLATGRVDSVDVLEGSLLTSGEVIDPETREYALKHMEDLAKRARTLEREINEEKRAGEAREA